MTTPQPAPLPKRVLSRIERGLRRRVPRPVYEEAVGGYYGLRKLAGRNPGRGRMLPDFVIIGAAKAGTTSLYAWLCDHPFVAPASRKEVHFFDYNYYRGEDWYRSHFPLERDLEEFQRVHGSRFLTGEASPPYLSHEWAPERVARMLPDVKLLVTLRNPVDRAYSQFQLSRREGLEPLDSFDDAIEIEDQRLDPERARLRADRRYNSWPIGCWSYLMRSRYAEQVEHWMRAFPSERFHFLTLEDLSADPEGTMAGVHEFLGLPPHQGNRVAQLHVASPDKMGAYEAMSPETRARLSEYFKPLNERLYELVGTDFGWDRPTAERSVTAAHQR